MKRRSFGFLLFFALLSSFVMADEARIYQSGTIVSVERQETENAYVGGATDAPLRSDVWAYRVSVQIGGTLYFGHYEAATGYVPGMWTRGHPVEVRIDKKQMYLRTPGGEEVKMQIVGRHRVPLSTGKGL